MWFHSFHFCRMILSTHSFFKLIFYSIFFVIISRFLTSQVYPLFIFLQSWRNWFAGTCFRVRFTAETDSSCELVLAVDVIVVIQPTTSPHATKPLLPLRHHLQTSRKSHIPPANLVLRRFNSSVGTQLLHSFRTACSIIWYFANTNVNIVLLWAQTCTTQNWTGEHLLY